jgi:hypothetical protein
MIALASVPTRAALADATLHARAHIAPGIYRGALMFAFAAEHESMARSPYRRCKQVAGAAAGARQLFTLPGPLLAQHGG